MSDTTGEATACLSVVIPCYNEEATVAEVIRRVLESALVAEVIVVDDGSTDGTVEAIESVLAMSPERIRLIRQGSNRGKGAALRIGFQAATADFVIVQDADLEYDPAEYPIVLEPLLQGKADVVYGSRFHSNRSHRVLYFWHSMGNKLLTLLSNMSTDLNLTDMETCYKAFRRELIQSIDIEEQRFGFEPEVTAKIAAAGARIYEVGISYDGRTYEEGKKIGWRDGVRALYCIAKYSPLIPRRVGTSRPRQPAPASEGMQENLEQLAVASNYADWVGDLVGEFVRGNVVEIGAGTGTITQRLLSRVDRLTVVEPNEELVAHLRRTVGQDPAVEVIAGTTNDLQGVRDCDAAVLVNVLEHIEDDGEALRKIREVLKPGGRLVLFVPAFDSLYSHYDQRIGHYRRYRRRALGRLLRRNGFQLVEARYLNATGFLLWWLGIKLLGQDPAKSAATRWFDRLVVPLQRPLESTVRLPFGLSILAVASRSPE